MTQVGAAPVADDSVVRAGDQSLSIASLEQRLTALTDLGLQAFGKDRESRLRGYLDQMVVPELLLDQAAQTQGLAQAAELRDERDQLLGQAIEHQVELSVPITDADVQRYFDEHRTHFERPAAILLWRILLDDAARARELIQQCQGAKGVVVWREFSREHSLDKATHLRDGLLGFVRADGTTEVPQLQVDKALYAAASKVADGELVKEPVAEGNRFAVVWRRGSRAAQSRPLAEVAPSIRAALLREKTHDELLRLLGTLRHSQLTQFHPEYIELADYTLPSFTPRDAFPQPSAAPGGSVRAPTATPRGLR
ncbi:MAG TPA: peptidyl-prolyl cis-trans isomerase [Polyangiaceae bacterium]|nr:peptidyl-prolyl cis-trans isomerase [Polyangiaceae bacterium]